MNDDLPDNVTPWYGRPDYRWNITREIGGTVLIQTVNANGGIGEQELWCTVDQARELAELLAVV